MQTVAVSRRTALRQMGGLLAATLTSGAALGAAADDARAKLSFVVLNDLHHDATEDCDAWFARLFTQVATRHAEAAACFALGDLAHRGQAEALRSLSRLAAAHLPMPFLPVVGNHDQDLETTPRLYLEAFPGRLNYVFRAGGWQFLLLDSTQGREWADTNIPTATLAWLDQTMPMLDRSQPTVIATHFPLSNVAKMCPLNADELLARFRGWNLRGTFSGHYHAQTVRRRDGLELVTNVCCSRVSENHDSSLQKGYYVAEAEPDGTLRRRFETVPEPIE